MHARHTKPYSLEHFHHKDMARIVKVAAAQVGAVHRTSTRQEVLARLIRLLEDAAVQGIKLVVFREQRPAGIAVEH